MKPAAFEPRRQAVLWILTAAAIVVLPHALRQPVWLTLAFAGLLAWRYAIGQRGWYRPGLVVRLALALLLAGAVFRAYGTLLGRDAGTAMLIVLTGMKFVESRTLRDYMLTVFLLYLLIATDFLYSQSLIHGAYLVVAGAACTLALAQLNRSRPRPWADDARLVLGLVLKAMPLMIVMYLLFPRIQGGLWGLPSDAFAGRTGLTEEMHPGSINQLNQSDATAFRVKFHGPHPPAKDMYWRALIMWQTDGRDWRAGTRFPADPRPTITSGTRYRYTVTLEPTQETWLAALDRPLTVPAGAHPMGGYLLRRRNPIQQRLRYQMVSQAQHRSGSLPAAQRRAGLQLPVTITARVRALAARWRQESGDAEGVVSHALAYFHNQNFVYTLTPPLLGDHPVDQFLFDTRRGYCEHYATSFVVLMRAAGIPARVVAGYQGGEYNKAGDYFIVRQADAHAWAEVWLRGRGWTRVDPTAAVAPERIEYGIDTLRRLRSEGVPLGRLRGDALARAMRLGVLARLWVSTRMYWDLVNMEWYRWVSDYGEARQADLLRALGLLTPSWLGRLAGLAAMVVLVTLVLAWLMGRRHVRDPALATYQRFCRKLARAGLARHTWEGACAYANRVRHARPDLEAGVDAITSLYVRLRYGSGGDPAQLREMKRQVRALRARPWWMALRRP
jgi:transglutaminase-like putative cysteine protease